jgi:hypothetical protein
MWALYHVCSLTVQLLCIYYFTGENFSIYHHRGNDFGLTPLYDALQTLADQYPDAEAWPAMIELAGPVEGTIKAVEKLLPEGFAESVWTPTSKGMLKQAKSFLSHTRGKKHSAESSHRHASFHSALLPQGLSEPFAKRRRKVLSRESLK